MWWGGGVAVSGVLLFTGSVLGAAAERHSDDTAGERHKQSVMVFIQLQSQNPPVLLALNVTPGCRQEAGDGEEHGHER